MLPTIHHGPTKSKRIELVLQQMQTLPTLPAVAARLLQLTVRSTTQASEVVRLIESDPSLASRIMQMVAHGGTGLKRSSMSVGKAVVLLGFDAVRNAVLSIKVFEALCRPSDISQTLDPTAFWKRSLAVGCAARLLAEKTRLGLEPEEAFLCGLLHNMGQLALVATLPKSYARVMEIAAESHRHISEVERRVLGLDHAAAGKRLAERWGLPPAVVETVWLADEPFDCLPESLHNRPMVQLVHVAAVLCREMHLGYSGAPASDERAADLAQALGCDADTFAKLSLRLCPLIAERAALLGLDEMETGFLYYDALGEANAELGRLNQHLYEQNRRLRTRGDYLEMAAEMGRALANCRTATDVCAAIVRTWQSHLHAKACLVYALAPSGDYLEGAFADADGAVRNFLVDDLDTVQAVRSAAEAAGATFTLHAATDTDQAMTDLVGAPADLATGRTAALLLGDKWLGAIIFAADPENDYADQVTDLAGFAAGAALALAQQQREEALGQLCEELAAANKRLRQSQAELAEKRSLAAVGEMACGAGHELNNPLAIIRGRAQLLAQSEADADRQRMLRQIDDRAAEASDIVSELLAFAAPRAAQPEYCCPQDLAAEAAAGCAAAAAKMQINITTQVDDHLPKVFVDPQQITAALREIILNAVEAYDKPGGAVTITAAEASSGDVQITITDAGCGMDAATLAKALTPFFSAKPAGRQRGLGLSKANRWIEINGGRLTLSATPGKGAAARVILPTRAVNRDEVSDDVTEQLPE